MKRLVSVVVVAVVLAPWVVFAQSAPHVSDQAPPQAQETTGTGRLSVLVVADDNGAPIKRTAVGVFGMVGTPVPPPGTGGRPAGAPGETAFAVVGGSVMAGSAGPGRVQKEGETDESGRVEFSSLPAGVYSVLIRSLPAGFVRPIASQSVPLKDGEAASQTVRLIRAGAITGRIVDDTGDPLSRVFVRAVRKDAGYGMPRLATAGASGTTDERGHYRIFDLAPGDYYVSASVMGQGSAGPATIAQTGPKFGFVPTFHPGVQGLEGAQAVGVRSGQDTAGVDFGMLRGRVARVTGTAVDSAGAPLSARSGSVMLQPRNRELSSFSRSGWLQDDGAFNIPDVPPGEYYFVALTRPPANQATAQPPPGREGVCLPVTVNGEDVTVSVQTNKGATLSGRVVREGPMPPPPFPGAPPPPSRSPQAMRPLIAAAPPTRTVFSPVLEPGRVEYFEEDGTFRITGARGTLLLSASSSVEAVKSIRRGARDLLGVPLDLSGTERLDDIEIVLTTETGWLSGSVTRADGKPADSAWVLVYSDNPKRWSAPFVSVSRTTGARPATSPMPTPSTASGAVVPGTRTPARAPGEFFVGRLLPGRYYVAALESGDGSFPAADAELLASLKAKAVAVTIVAGETATVQVKQ